MSKKTWSIVLIVILALAVIYGFVPKQNKEAVSTEATAVPAPIATEASQATEVPATEAPKADAATEAPKADPAAKKAKIGILAPAVTHGWVAAVAYNAELRCKELGIEYNIATSKNAEEMTAQLSDLLSWGANAIVAFPQWQGMEEPIKEALAKGVFVVNFDIDINAEGVYKVTGDNYDMGVKGAEYIVSKVGPEAVVAMLEVPTSGSVSELRKGGFMDTIQKIAPKLQVLTYSTKFTREDGLKDMADVLTANPKIDAVFSMDDETSIGALQAIKEAKRTDVKAITGGGGCQEYFKLMPDNQEIWIQSALYSPAMVKDAVDMAIDLLNGKKVETPKIIPTTVVDRENCAQYLDANSPY